MTADSPEEIVARERACEEYEQDLAAKDRHLAKRPGRATTMERRVADAAESLARELDDAGVAASIVMHYRALAEHIYEHGIATKAKARIGLRTTGFITRYPCALCGGYTDKQGPWLIVLESDDGWQGADHVCDECAAEVEPDIIQARDMLNHAVFPDES
jgi:hypothetical protein